MDNQLEQPPSPQPSLSTASQPTPPKAREVTGKKRLLAYLLILILIGGGAYGAYYWQNTKVKDLNSKLDSAKSEVQKLEQDKKQLEDTANKKVEETKTAVVNNDLIPGQAETNRTDGRILITAVYKPANAPEEIWIDYGESPDKLDKSTVHATKALGLGDPNQTYTFGQSLEIPKASVKEGTSYFYRVSAKTAGKTVSGPVASFTVIK